MALYYFDVNDGNAVSVDDDGIDCDDLAQVRYRAIDALPEMARDELPDGDDRTFEVRVRDWQGRVVLTCRLHFSIDWAPSSD